uniref:Uncharacterized protein n=1 Tax=viral metagenome TaxID=1070528 RepID=A0A6C0F197_9ZZZZ
MKSKKSSSRFSGSSDILHNKYVLYLSFFFAIVTAAGYLLRNNLEAICIFVIIGFLTTYFSKNMIIVLLVTTIATNFIVLMKNRNSSMIEGLETKEDPTATSPDGGASSSSESSVNPQATKTHEADMAPVASANEVSKSISGKNRKTEGLSNLSPAPVESEGNSMLDLQKGMASGYGAQKEQAYKALASLGGAGAGGSASNFSAETINSQNEMINNLKSIQPILDTAEKFLDKFENSSISKMVSNMGSMPGMSLLTGGLGKTASPAGPVGAES